MKNPDGMRLGPSLRQPVAGASRRPRPGGVARETLPPQGPFCWQCERYAVDTDGDLCDLCLDAVEEELSRRMVDRGW